AVIKVPMLLNEAKFLGLKFMAIRWVLTVIAIIIFSWISAKIIKDEDLPGEVLTHPGLHINREACMGCTLCAKNYPALFEIKGKKADIKAYGQKSFDLEHLQSTIEACPVHAIEYFEG
ncbi:MAG TPA: permease, partial [Ruminiclostridium sp.]|nr:permease [Ruminiclostridium sp.]